MGIPTSDECLNAAEKSLGCKLPIQLRDRLKSNNGGEIAVGAEQWQLFSVWDQSSRKSMTRSASHIVSETESARLWRGFPSNGIAIGSGTNGDLLVLFDGSSEIFMWRHETGECEPMTIDW